MCVCIYSNILHLRTSFQNPHFVSTICITKYSKEGFISERQKLAPATQAMCKWAPSEWRKPLVSFCKCTSRWLSEAFVLTSAELKINYTMCVLTACFIQSSNETRILCNSKGNKVRLLSEKDKVTWKQKSPAAWGYRCGMESNSAHTNSEI